MESFDREKAAALFKGGLGKAEGEFIGRVATPFYWYWQTDRGVVARNGSIFFMDCGAGCFGVTADHVIDGYLQDAAVHPTARLVFVAKCVDLRDDGAFMPMNWA